METKYLAVIKKYEAEIATNSKTSNRLGYAKLLAFLFLLVSCVILFASGFAPAAVAATVILFGMCVWLWVWHYRLDTTIQYAQGIVLICNRHLDRINGNWASFDDAGREFIDSSHHYANDLDIVGAKSVFQFLNTTHTWHGRQAFAGDLLQPRYSAEEITQRQAAIEELSTDINFTNNMEYYLMQIGKNQPDVTNLANHQPFLRSQFWRFTLCYIPVVTVVLLLAGLIFQMQGVIAAGLAVLVLQVALGKIVGGNAWEYLKPVGKHKLGKYVQVINTIKGREFACDKLNQIKQQLAVAAEAVQALEKISNRLNFIANPVIYFVLDWLLLWNIHAALLLERWKIKYAHMCSEWFAAIGEFESLAAFSHLPNVCEGVCLPQLVATPGGFAAEGIGHPLLANGKRVCNDVNFNGNIFIISGSNMSGKTTFMRTVGVNLLLARTGSFVCATKMTCSLFNIVTSMRIADDLNQGVSTFYAELTRIKLILDTVEERTIFLIDEIFKGTNSVDRLAGADAVITKLEAMGAVGMVSTHDLELCKLADIHSRILNLNFSEHYKNGKIYFDYTLRTGQSQTTNARFLMEMIGL